MDGYGGDEEVPALKRGLYGQPLQQTQRGKDGGAIGKSLKPDPDAAVTKKKEVRRKFVKNKTKSKRQSKAEKQKLKEYSRKHDVMSALENESSGLTFHQPLCGDADEAKRR